MSTLVVVFMAALVAAVHVIAAPHRSLENGTTYWPSLRFQFTVKRSSTKVHGQSDFTMFANPVTSRDEPTLVLYDTVATLTQDATVFNYTTVNGVSYFSQSSIGSDSATSVQCYESDILPSLNSIIIELSEASPVSSILKRNGDPIDCFSEERFKVSVNDIPFGLCYKGSSGFSLYGDDMDINVEYSHNIKEILIPVPDDNSAKCPAMATSYSVTSIGKSLLTGQPIPTENARMLKPALGFSLDASTCSCKSTPRPCIFIHGQGIKKEMAENQDVFPMTYWENMTDHAPCCTSLKFAVLNTVNNSWTDDKLQQKVCDRALAVSATSSNSEISDTIIITHSMGALMLGGAIASGKCSLPPSTTWISTGAPMRGSMGSDYLQGSCDGVTNRVMEKLANVTGRCPVSAAVRSLAYEHGDYASVKLNRAYKEAQEVYRTHVKAAMCSYKHSGLISSYQWQFWLLGKVVPHNSPQNDGMVEFHSCAGSFPESRFDTNYREPFYVTKLNHFDVAFQSGDALLDEAKMPMKWFECLL